MSKMFSNRTIVIATMHWKEQVISPLLSEAFTATCIVPEWLNTDKFGTFTRDVKRVGNMLESARAKIDKAMEKTGCDIAIASEWSFGAHPTMPFMQSNFELTVLYDAKNKREIRGHYRTWNTNMHWTYIHTVDEALTFAEKSGFPDHGIIVRRWKEGKRWIDKDIETEKDLIQSVEHFLKWPFTSKIYLETDMRAHKNPTRMQAIEKSTKNLIANANSLCPSCEMPWFIVKEVNWALLCGWCAQATQLPIYEIKRCDSCAYQENVPITKYGEYADPSYCCHCNP